jgi:uncharacterized protein YgbK (DUF1537 family)
MIAVIADDFTGAAELGGIGLRHRLAVEISTVVNVSTKAGLLVIATDTRSMQREAAVAEMEKITRQLSLLQPEWIYKKVDSVLRGYVIPEIKAQLKALGGKRALLIPANPALGRTIIDGHYFLNGQPVHQSAFSIDPEFPVTSSGLQDMLHTRQEPVPVRRVSDPLPDSGIIVGEVKDVADLSAWAGLIDKTTFLAGASGFFSALLSARTYTDPSILVRHRPPGSPALFVSGSTFDKSREAIWEKKSQGGPVSYMPAALETSQQEEGTSYDKWCEEVIAFLRQQGKAIVAIRGEGDGARSARWLKIHTAQLVRRVLQQVSIEELAIEGGATAYAILEQAGFRTFFPEQELAPGVIRMKVKEAPLLYLTVKPGSYNWPGSLQY